MKTFMVVAKFKSGVTPEDIKALVPEEVKQAKILEDQGLLGKIKVAMPKRTVFLEAFGESEELVSKNIDSLPLSKIWDFELFETTPPAGVGI